MLTLSELVVIPSVQKVQQLPGKARQICCAGHYQRPGMFGLCIGINLHHRLSNVAAFACLSNASCAGRNLQQALEGLQGSGPSISLRLEVINDRQDTPSTPTTPSHSQIEGGGSSSGPTTPTADRQGASRSQARPPRPTPQRDALLNSSRALSLLCSFPGLCRWDTET